MNSLLKKCAFLFIISFLFSSCSAIGEIFKAGIGVGIFLVVVVVAVIILVIKRFSSKN